MRRPLLVLLTALVLCVTACSSAAAGGGPSGSGTPAATPYPTPSGRLGHRPLWAGKITLVAPVNGETVHGTSILVRVSVAGGVVTPTLSAIISPTKGHVHLYLNNQ